MWRVLIEVVAMGENLGKWGLRRSECSLCGAKLETYGHLLFECSVAQDVWLHYFLVIFDLPQ